MRKLYENFYSFHFQKRIVSTESTETICENTLIKETILGFLNILEDKPDFDNLGLTVTVSDPDQLCPGLIMEL